ncbi:MAG: formylglycine-generating enzyme family protein [Candidatus Eisenbacteria bacterium]|nr:formylglycine-generating enzyme family protein [Candidatus Eisenbacteria bacterium]
MLNRLLIAALVMLIFVGLVSAVWNLCDWPPPRLILKYGFPPTGGPTGRTMTIEGVEFVELKPGYFRMGSHFWCEEGDCLGRVCAVLHLPWGRQPKHDSRECPPHWVEIERGFWIAARPVSLRTYMHFDPEQLHSSRQDGASPVTDVTWSQARAFCAWISARGSLRMRLPSEAEWEYALWPLPLGVTGVQWELLPATSGLSIAPFDVPGRISTIRYQLDVGQPLEWCQDSWHDNFCGAPVDGAPWETRDELTAHSTEMIILPHSSAPRKVVRGAVLLDGIGEVKQNVRWRAGSASGERWIAVRLAADSR